jgi:hypothetical protein
MCDDENGQGVDHYECPQDEKYCECYHEEGY